MIAVVQRVLNASVSVDSPPYNKSIEAGLCVFLGVEEGDDSSHATWMAKKLSNLRIFKDENEKMNCSLLDIKGELLLISQFTLVGDCSKGNRPSFIHAARPEIAEPLVQLVSEILQVEHHIAVKNGVFGAMMEIQITNDGPVTLIVQRD